jgi:hypothetical protein
MHAAAFLFAVQASLHLSRFGASVASIVATQRFAKSQSGCLSYGSLLTNRRRQSATHLRHVGSQSFGCQRNTAACNHSSLHGSGVEEAILPLDETQQSTACPSAAVKQKRPSPGCRRMAESLQTVFIGMPRHRESVMQPASISHSFEVSVLSPTLASVRSLTQRSSGHQYLPASIGTLRATHSGAAYLGR